MRKFKLTSGLPVIVLAAGLVSCVQEKEKTKDIYKVPPPIILKEGRSTDLTTLGLQGDRGLDISDAMDLTQSNAQNIEIKSSCLVGETALDSVATPRAGSPVKVFELLNEKVLLTDLSTHAVVCAFEFTFANDIGSKHIFNVPGVKIIDDGRGEARVIARDGAAPRLIAGEEPAVSIEFNHRDDTRMSVIGPGMTIPDVNFEQQMSSLAISPDEIVLRPEAAATALLERPVQTCRVLMKQAGRAVAISSLFQVLALQERLQIRVEQDAGAPNAFDAEGNGQTMIAMLRDFHFSRLRVQNTGAGSRYFVAPKTLGPIWTRYFIHTTRRSVSMKIYEFEEPNRPFQEFSLPAQDRGDHFLITIPPGSELMISHRLQSAHFCNIYDVKAASYQIRYHEHYYEVDANGERLREYVPTEYLPTQIQRSVNLAAKLSDPKYPVVSQWACYR